MKQNLKQIIKFMALCVILALSSCEKDLYDETLSSQKRLLMKEVSLKDFSVKTNSKLMKVVDELNQRKLKTSGKIVYDSIKNFWYDDEKGIYIENGFIHSYTFNVERQNSDGKIEKIVFQSDGNDGYKTLLVKYDFTKEELAQMNDAQLMLEEVVVNDISTSKCAGDVDLTVICNYEYTLTTVTAPNFPPCDQPGVKHENGEECQTQFEWVTTGYSCSYEIHSDGCGGDEFSGGHEGGESPSNPQEGSGGVVTTPIPCLFCSEPDIMRKTPCDKVKDQNTNFPSLKQSLVTLATSTSQNHENGIFIDNTATTTTADPIQTIQNNNTNGGTIILNMNPTNKYIMLAHTHDSYGTDGTGTYSIFSWDDLTTINNLLVKNHIDNSSFVFYLITADGTRYALTVDSPSNLRSFFYNPSNLPFGTEIDTQKILDMEKVFQKYYDKSKNGLITTTSSIINDKSNFLKFIKEANLGITVFEVDAAFSTYQKLTISDSGLVTPTPCN